MNTEILAYPDSGMHCSPFEKGTLFPVRTLLVCFHIFFKLFLCKFDEERKASSKLVIDHLGLE